MLAYYLTAINVFLSPQSIFKRGKCYLILQEKNKAKIRKNIMGIAHLRTEARSCASAAMSLIALYLGQFMCS